MNLKLRDYILLLLYGAAAAAITAVTFIVDAGRLSLVFVLLSIIGILLNSYMRGEGLLFLAAGSAVFIYINFANKFYGEAALYILFVAYYVVSFFIYKKDFATRSIRLMKIKSWIICAGIGACAVPLYYLLLKQTGSNQPLLNSFSTFFNCIAVLLTARKNLEQFLAWAVINVVQAVLWLTTLSDMDKTYLPIIIFNLFMIGINAYNFIKWQKLLKEERIAQNINQVKTA